MLRNVFYNCQINLAGPHEWYLAGKVRSSLSLNWRTG